MAERGLPRALLFYGSGDVPRFGIPPSDPLGGESRRFGVGADRNDLLEVLFHLPFLRAIPHIGQYSGTLPITQRALGICVLACVCVWGGGVPCV